MKRIKLKSSIRLKKHFQNKLCKYAPVFYGSRDSTMFEKEVYKTLAILFYAQTKRLPLKGTIIGYGAQREDKPGEVYYKVRLKHSIGSINSIMLKREDFICTSN